MRTQNPARREGLLAAITLTFLLAPSVRAEQAAIAIDGDFSDWSGIATAAIDPAGDDGPSGIDFGALRIADDDRFLFLQVALGPETQLDELNDLVLYLDTDASAATGFPVAGIGAELEWRLGDRVGTFDPAGAGAPSTVFHEMIGFSSAPTVSGAVHELAIDRTTLPDGAQPLFLGATVRIVIRDEDGAGDRIPDGSGGVVYTLGVGAPVTTAPVPLGRADPDDLRLVTWNVLQDGPWVPGEASRFGRVLAAIEPDIVCFQEIYNHTAAQAASFVATWVPAPGSVWQGVGASDCKIVSRFPVLGSFAVDGNLVAHIDATARMGTPVLVVSAHLPCCANDAGRQEEIDRLLGFLREAMLPGGALTVAPGTPILVGGDMNLVGLAAPLESLLAGEITDEAQNGPDFAPDWDGSALANVLPRLTETPLGYTWRSDTSSFWPGHLDYWAITDSVAEVARSYALYTPEMSPSALSAAGLFAGDVLGSDHLPFVIDLRPPGSSAGPFRRSDCNGDGDFDISDAVHALTALFMALSTDCLDACDGNDDGAFDIADVVWILAHQFSAGAPPPAPFPGCGADPSADGLPCAAYPGC